jgi:hypothetical protein
MGACAHSAGCILSNLTVLFSITILQYALVLSDKQVTRVSQLRAPPRLLYSYPLSFSWHSHYTRLKGKRLKQRGGRRDPLEEQKIILGAAL